MLCSYSKGNLSILIDTSPDIKNQFLKNKIKTLDAIIYTHEHADQTTGILKDAFWKNKKNTNLRIFKNNCELKINILLF